MNILPKQQDILKAKNDERKKEIDDGVSLANRIDKLRETKASEERALFHWRKTSLATIQNEIDQFIEQRNNLEEECNDARRLREELLKPLDGEWEEINNTIARLAKEKDRIYLAGEQLKENIKKDEQQREKLSKLIIKVKDNEKETEKAKSEIIALKEMAQREFEMAHEEHETNTKLSEQKLLNLSRQEREYESAMKINALEEKRLQDFEQELIIRQAQLQDREDTLERELRRIQNAKSDS